MKTPKTPSVLHCKQSGCEPLTFASMSDLRKHFWLAHRKKYKVSNGASPVSIEEAIAVLKAKRAGFLEGYDSAIDVMMGLRGKSGAGGAQ